MSITFQQLVDMAVSIAGRAIEPSQSPALAAEMVAEDLVSPVFNAVARKVAGDAALRPLLRRDNTIAFTNGSATLTQDVLVEYLDESLLFNTAAATTRYSWEPQFASFVRANEPRLGFYAVNEGTIYVIEPNATYSPGAGLTGNRVLTTPCVPAVPTTATSTITIRDELLDDLVLGLANALRGGAV